MKANSSFLIILKEKCFHIDTSHSRCFKSQRNSLKCSLDVLKNRILECWPIFPHTEHTVYCPAYLSLGGAEAAPLSRCAMSTQCVPLPEPYSFTVWGYSPSPLYGWDGSECCGACEVLFSSEIIEFCWENKLLSFYIKISMKWLWQLSMYLTINTLMDGIHPPALCPTPWTSGQLLGDATLGCGPSSLHTIAAPAPGQTSSSPNMLHFH